MGLPSPSFQVRCLHSQLGTSGRHSAGLGTGFGMHPQVCKGQSRSLAQLQEVIQLEGAGLQPLRPELQSLPFQRHKEGAGEAGVDGRCSKAQQHGKTCTLFLPHTPTLPWACMAGQRKGAGQPHCRHDDVTLPLDALQAGDSCAPFSRLGLSSVIWLPLPPFPMVGAKNQSLGKTKLWLESRY